VPQAEPVGEVVEVNNDGFRCEFSQRLAVGTKLYTFPPAAQPVQEPETFERWNAKQHGDPEEIGFLQALRIAYCAGQDSVTTPPAPQRPWQGLTDDDVHELTKNVIAFKSDIVDFIGRAEAKLKEKNSLQIEFLYALYQQASSQRDILMAQQTQQIEAWKQRSKEAKTEWQGLTEDDVNEVYAAGDAYRIRIVRLIEAKLKEKNT
jgi:hypothetical protein